MNTKVLMVSLLVLLACACGDGRRATFDKELETCEAALRQGLLDSAEQACGRALAVTDSPDFDPALRSGALYRLGHIKRQQAKFVEAEELQRQSLLIAQQQDNPDAMEIGRRLVEIALNLAGQGRWSDGARVLERLVPMADTFTGTLRKDASNVLRQYSFRLAGSGQAGLAEQFKSKAATLKTAAPGVEATSTAGEGQ